MTLLPAIVQDPDTRRVLMLGHMSEEALRLTRETGLVHFWSRTRSELWRKGATSGHTLEAVDVRFDCDRDALLVLARPTGPTCHAGTPTCFDDGPLGEGFARLEELWSTIASRAGTRPPGSYTARLVEGGPDLAARKLVEEAVEVLVAAKDHAAGHGDLGRLAEEAADLVYHLLAVCAERGMAPKALLDVLAERRR